MGCKRSLLLSATVAAPTPSPRSNVGCRPESAVARVEPGHTPINQHCSGGRGGPAHLSQPRNERLHACPAEPCFAKRTFF